MTSCGIYHKFTSRLVFKHFPEGLSPIKEKKKNSITLEKNFPGTVCV